MATEPTIRRRILVVLAVEEEVPATEGARGREDEPRRCTKCGAIVRWDDLRPIGIQRIPGGSDLELRNCRCGTTLARELPETVETEGEPVGLLSLRAREEGPPSERPRKVAA